jgi:mono/diheme cytochrome c family protein
VIPGKLKRFLHCVPAFAMIGIVLPGAGAQAQKALDASEQSTPLIQSVKGADLFRAYCASCHGGDAKGKGPAASALKATVPDLTLLSRRNLGRFPAAHVREVILGERVVAAHGSREMPIWGPIFHQVEGDQDWGNVRLENLVKYLASIQSIQAAASSPAVELYKRH